MRLKRVKRIHFLNFKHVFKKLTLMGTNIYNFINNRKKFFLERLKLPSKIFQNSNLLDLGCGSGQNTIFYEKIGDSNTSREQKLKNLIKVLESQGFKIKNKK